MPASEPLRIQELPPRGTYPASTYPGYNDYTYPSVTPAPHHYQTPAAAAPVAPAAPAVPFRTPKNLFSNHFSFNLGKK